MDSFATSLAIESWILYVIGIFLIGCRLVSRRIARRGWKNLEIDDYLMLLVVIAFTGTIVSCNQVAQNSSNYLPPGVAEHLTPKQHQSAVWGSKMTFALEHFTLCSLWLVKACLLFVYNRLTLGLKEHLAVKAMAIYVACSFVLVELLFLTCWCPVPTSNYWTVPVQHRECATYYRHLITTTVFNISSDLMMLAIPLPLLIRSRLPWRRKILLCLVFSLGIFVVLMAILNRYYNFTKQYTLTFLKWYVAEVATSVYVANLPLLWPLLKEVFHLRTFAGSSDRPSGLSKRTGGPGPTHLRSRLYSRPSRPSRPSYDSSTETIMNHTSSGIAKGGGLGESSNVSEPALELTPMEERHYRAMVTAEDGGATGTTPPDSAPGEMGIVRTVEVHQWRE